MTVRSHRGRGCLAWGAAPRNSVLARDCAHAGGRAPGDSFHIGVSRKSSPMFMVFPVLPYSMVSVYASRRPRQLVQARWTPLPPNS